MAEGEQVVATMGQISIEAARLLAAAIGRIFEEAMHRTRAEYKAQKAQAELMASKWEDEKAERTISKNIAEGGFIEDYTNLKAHEDPKDPFVAQGYAMTEEDAHNLMDMAKGESIPYSVVKAGMKNDLGQDYYFIVTRQSDMAKVSSMFDKAVYDKRLRGIDKVVQDVGVSLESKKTELAQLESEPQHFDIPAERQERIVQLRKEIAEDTMFISQMSAEYKLAKSAQTYLVNKIRLGDIIENLKQEYQDKAEIRAIDDDISKLKTELSDIVTENESLQNEMTKMQKSDSELSEQESAQYQAMQDRFANNNAKIDSLQSDIVKYEHKKEAVIQRQINRKTNATSVKANESEYKLESEPLSFKEAINRMTDRTVSNGEKHQHYFLLDKNNPTKYIECNAVNDTVDDKTYMKTTYTVFSNDKAVQTTDDGRVSGESQSEHNIAWAKKRSDMQSSNGFSDNILFCEDKEQLARYQTAIRNGAEITQSKVDGFDEKQQDIMNLLEVDERNYDKRIAELTAELDSKGCVYQLSDDLSDGSVVELDTGVLTEDIEAILIAKQISNYTQLRNVNAEMAKETVNSLIPVPNVQENAEKKLVVLKETKKELCETEIALNNDRLELATALAAEKENDNIFADAVATHQKETTIDLDKEVNAKLKISLDKDITADIADIEYDEPKLETRTPSQIGKDYDAKSAANDSKNPVELNKAQKDVSMKKDRGR